MIKRKDLNIEKFSFQISRCVPRKVYLIKKYMENEFILLHFNLYEKGNSCAFLQKKGVLYGKTGLLKYSSQMLYFSKYFLMNPTNYFTFQNKPSISPVDNKTCLSLSLKEDTINLLEYTQSNYNDAQNIEIVPETEIIVCEEETILQRSLRSRKRSWFKKLYHK